MHLTASHHPAAHAPALHKRGPRLFWLDLLRVVAMVDIVTIHTTEAHLLGGIGLPLLLLTAAAFGAIRSRMLTPRQLLVRRARRLLLPWFSWCVIYTIVFMAMAYRHQESLLGWVEPFMIFYGPAIHLWFVLFAFLSASLIAMTSRAIRGLSLRHSIGVVTCIGILTLLVTSLIRVRFHPPVPFPQWIFSLSAIPLGLALGLAMGDAKPARRTRSLLLLACVGVVLVFIGYKLLPIIPWNHEDWLVRRFGYALATLAVAAVWPGRDLPGANILVTATFGVYLAHPLVFMLLREIEWLPAAHALQIIVVYGLSLALAAGLLRTRLRWMV